MNVFLISKTPHNHKAVSGTHGFSLSPSLFLSTWCYSLKVCKARYNPKDYMVTIKIFHRNTANFLYGFQKGN